MLQVEHIAKRYGSVVAVADVSFRVDRGEIFGLLGPNGAGKSTTLEIVAGLRRPDSGTVSIDGDAPFSRTARARIGLATQAIALYEEFSADRNLRFFGRLQGLRGRSLSERVDRVIEIAQLEAPRARTVGTYSGGMKRRLNLAVALLGEPSLLLLDEPTAGVDPQSRNALLETVESLRDAGHGIVYTTHYMEEAQRVCDRVAIIDSGRVLVTGTVDELLQDHGGSSRLVVDRAGVVTRTTTDDPLKDLVPLVADPSITGLQLHRPDLEAVFLSLTGRSLRDEAGAA